jgi:hypothetical protein
VVTAAQDSDDCHDMIQQTTLWRPLAPCGGSAVVCSRWVELTRWQRRRQVEANTRHSLQQPAKWGRHEPHAAGQRI